MNDPRQVLLDADFNGLFGEWLCLSHTETCRGVNGEEVTVHEGMTATAIENDFDYDGNTDQLDCDRDSGNVHLIGFAAHGRHGAHREELELAVISRTSDTVSNRAMSS